ncbi:MAG: protocatechuate 3,4-dioxygenase subunit alpha [Rhizobiales bacterium]|nr:protocatechuate 3,4-dioxygenase subunit alpha [Hyphomicrobiales bacterium]
MSGITPSATVGPFFLFGLVPSSLGGTDIATNDLVTPDASGERIRIEGRVLDGDGAVVPDALVEIWQADAQGRYASPADTRARPNATFKGFGRAATDAEGRYAFETMKPGAVPAPGGGTQAPHILVNLFARGVVKQMVTRIYFSDEAANAADPVLALVPAERRNTLVANRRERDGRTVYIFDFHLQGDAETVFFEA